MVQEFKLSLAVFLRTAGLHLPAGEFGISKCLRLYAHWTLVSQLMELALDFSKHAMLLSLQQSPDCLSSL